MSDPRWRARVAHPPRLDHLLEAVREHDPTAHLVPGPGPDGTVAGTGAPVPRVAGVTLDSAQVRPGDLFAGLPGARAHGGAWAGSAARAGAVAMLSDRASPELPTLVVRDPRAVLGPLAARVHGDPSSALAVHGVTGTNGKTSTTHLIAAGLEAAGRPYGLAGTVGDRTPGHRRPAARTTAEAPVLAELLATARADGATDVALEVSSHGLALRRVDGIRFRTAVFTNLSADHLDLHGDLESYFATKAALFTPERAALAVVGVDDAWGRRLARTTRCPVVTVSAHGHAADWRADEVRADLHGTAFRLRGPGVDRPVALRLLGAHQADNALAAVAALVTDGVAVDDAVRGVGTAAGVPGRLERVEAGQPFPAFVDFAHNPGGHARLLPFLRGLVPGRVVAVVGLTGDRDPGKRAALGAAVAAAADLVVVTDESAHSEDPAALRSALAAAARDAGGAEVVVEGDRARAFDVAVAATGADDVLVVVGRGADVTQVAGERSRTFDDRRALHAALHARYAPATG